MRQTRLALLIACLMLCLPRLTEAAIESVLRWRYKPALKEGKPVDAYVTMVVDFFLRGVH